MSSSGSNVTITVIVLSVLILLFSLFAGSLLFVICLTRHRRRKFEEHQSTSSEKPWLPFETTSDESDSASNTIARVNTHQVFRHPSISIHNVTKDGNATDGGLSADPPIILKNGEPMDESSEEESVEPVMRRAPTSQQNNPSNQIELTEYTRESTWTEKYQSFISESSMNDEPSVTTYNIDETAEQANQNGSNQCVMSSDWSEKENSETTFGRYDDDTVKN